MDDRGGRGRADPKVDLPQDARVDRRSFLRRMGVLLAVGTGAVAPPVPIRASVGTPSKEILRRSREEAMARLAARGGSGLASEPADLTVAESLARMREGDFSPEELLESFLARIRAWDRVYLAYNEVPEARARSEAARPGLQSEEGGLLAGIPVAVKDNVDTRGVRTTANSWIYQDHLPREDAALVERLVSRGGILLGKTQMGPLATTRALTPDGRITTVNAWAPGDPSVSPGGSSSGSATAVAARLAPVAIGTQTGGSITTPALAQGLTGLKPTLGRVPLHGVIPLTWTRDHPGPIARDALDAALLLQAIAGSDPRDPRSIGLPPVPDYVRAATPTEPGGVPRVRWPTRIGVPPDWEDSEDPTIRADRNRFLRGLEALGVELVPLVWPEGWEEATSPALNAARLPERSEIHAEWLRADVRLFGVALAPWMQGLLVPADDYLRAQRARAELLRIVLEGIFTRCDLVLQGGSLPFDLIGLPLIAFPIGSATRGRHTLPHGVLLGGPPFSEERLLAVAAAWQAISDAHLARPPLPWEAGASLLPEVPSAGRGRVGVESVAELAE